MLPYILFEKYIYILALEMASPGNQHCVNNTINIFFETAIGILVISEHNSFRVRFDKMLPYILFEKYIYILALEMASPGNQHCVNCIGALSFPMASRIA